MATPKKRPLWTPDELADATRGKWITPVKGEFTPARVSYDVSDPRMPNVIAVLRNPRSWRANIPDDVGAAPALAKNGVAALVVDKEQVARIRTMGLPKPVPLLLVESTRRALTDLCVASRTRFQGKVVGLTGTVGKTTTREMLRHVLALQGGADATRGNNNNIAGCERSMAYIPRDLGYAVIEMGFGNPLGGISQSSKLVAPHVGLVTWVDLAHIDTFPEPVSSTDVARRMVAEQKLGLVDGVVRDGTLVYPRDNVTWDAAVAKTKHYGRKLVGFGKSSEADVRLTAFSATETGSVIDVDVAGKTVRALVNIPGEHMAMNAVATLATVHALGADVAAAAAALESFKAVGGRSEIVQIQTADGGRATLIDDSFNATPESIRSTLRLLAIEGERRGGRRIAILGDILHLGATSKDLHASLAKEVAEARVDRLFTTGKEMRHLYEAAPEATRAAHDDDLIRLYASIRAELRDGDVVTAKSSTPINTMAIAKALRAGQEQLKLG